MGHVDVVGRPSTPGPTVSRPTTGPSAPSPK